MKLANIAKRRHLHSGFTLVEIMIVLAIIGIIMGIGGTLINRAMDKTRRTQTEATLREVQNAVIQYQLETGRYPQSLQDLLVRPASVKRWTGPYVDNEDALKDRFGNEIAYELKPAGSRPPYDMWSWGENGPESPENEWIRLQS